MQLRRPTREGRREDAETRKSEKRAVCGDGLYNCLILRNKISQSYGDGDTRTTVNQPHSKGRKITVS